MLSMQKVYEVDKIVVWIRRYARNGRIIIMPKYDGIALVRYADGTIATRGDGKVGENVTDVAAPLFSGNSTIGYGECVCPLKEFAELGKYGYKNPRNAVSGIMGSLDAEIQKRVKHLQFVPYTKIASFLDCYGTSIDWLRQAIEQIVFFLRKEAGAIYPLDGIVFRIDDEELFQKLGHTDHHWRGQIALKFANEAAESVIMRIDWTEKNGTITPVALIRTVTLGGAEISRVTLHNANRVREWDIRVGDHCLIERAGGVIPKITRTWHSETSASERGIDWLNKTPIPMNCPTCGNRLNEVGARLYCPECDK
jgi:DNA ligase (NAD+)